MMTPERRAVLNRAIRQRIGASTMTTGQQMNAFWTRYAERLAEAMRTPIGPIMQHAGFRLASTGGNCWAWEYRLPSGPFVWICDEDNDLGERESQTYVIGCYRNDDDEGTCDVCASLKDALDLTWHYLGLARTAR
jgi:hypothetical protein